METLETVNLHLWKEHMIITTATVTMVTNRGWHTEDWDMAGT